MQPGSAQSRATRFAGSPGISGKGDLDRRTNRADSEAAWGCSLLPQFRSGMPFPVWRCHEHSEQAQESCFDFQTTWTHPTVLRHYCPKGNRREVCEMRHQ
jgi:hypothetical protein